MATLFNEPSNYELEHTSLYQPTLKSTDQLQPLSSSDCPNKQKLGTKYLPKKLLTNYDNADYINIRTLYTNIETILFIPTVILAEIFMPVALLAGSLSFF